VNTVFAFTLWTHTREPVPPVEDDEDEW
jgi:hypothetical protein